MINIQSDSATPLYVQLMEQLRHQVVTGDLRPGDRLPSFAQLREDYGIHKNTVERAHMLLESEGLVVREQGRGTFVAEKRRAQKHDLIGFYGIGFMNSESSSYWAQLLSGAQQVAMALCSTVL